MANVNATAITFVREKTKRTNKANPVTITVPRNEYINKIINKWGVKSFQTTDYVFGTISRNDSAELIRNTAKQFTQVTNKWTKRMGRELGFDVKLTTYVARHSFATILVRSGAPMKLASQSLGHVNLSTSERYLIPGNHHFFRVINIAHFIE